MQLQRKESKKIKGNLMKKHSRVDQGDSIKKKTQQQQKSLEIINTLSSIVHGDLCMEMGIQSSN